MYNNIDHLQSAKDIKVLQLNRLYYAFFIHLEPFSQQKPIHRTHNCLSVAYSRESEHLPRFGLRVKNSESDEKKTDLILVKKYYLQSNKGFHFSQ